MKIRAVSVFLTLSFALAACATSSADEQRKAVEHQNKSDAAASQGQYGIAGDEQRKAEDSHHAAVNKALDEGKPVPRQTAPDSSSK